jgi:hypothetical protein
VKKVEDRRLVWTSGARWAHIGLSSTEDLVGNNMERLIWRRNRKDFEMSLKKAART